MRSPNERLLDVLNKSTATKLKVSDVEITNVRTNDNESIKRNTRCLLLARENGKLRGSMEFYYNRLDLAKLFHGVNPTLLFAHADRVTTQQLAEQLGKQFGVELYGEDVEQSGEIYLTRFPTEVVLRAKPGSYCVVNELTVILSDRGTNVATALGVNTLSGLNPPNGNFDLYQGCLYSWDWQAQADLSVLLKNIPIGGAVPAEACPFITELDGTLSWVFEASKQEANLFGSKLVYLGNRESHPDYGNGSRRDEIAVIRLNDDLNAKVGGELVISLL